jgi:hypothetical protein
MKTSVINKVGLERQQTVKQVAKVLQHHPPLLKTLPLLTDNTNRIFRSAKTKSLETQEAHWLRPLIHKVVTRIYG